MFEEATVCSKKRLIVRKDSYLVMNFDFVFWIVILQFPHPIIMSLSLFITIQAEKLMFILEIALMLYVSKVYSILTTQ